MAGVARLGRGADAIDRIGGHHHHAAALQHRDRIGENLLGRVVLRTGDDPALGLCLGRGRRQLALADGNQEARAAREVAAHLHSRPPALGAGQVGRGIKAVLVQLDREHAARHKGRRRRLKQAAVDVQAVLAARKRKLGLELGHLGGELAHHSGRDVGRVGGEHREGAHELGGHAGDEVALDHVNGIGKAQGIAVLAREGHGDMRDVGRRHEGAGALAGNGAAHATRSATNLKHADGAHSTRGVNALEGGVHQQLGLGTRDENALAASDVDEAEARLAGDVLERLALGAARHEAVHARKLVGGERLVKGHVKAGAILACGRAQQPLGREARMLVALAAEVASRPLEATLYGPGLFCRHHSSVCGRVPVLRAHSYAGAVGRHTKPRSQGAPPRC